MNLKASAAKGMKWSAVESIGRQILNFIVFAALARLVQPDAFGVIALGGVYVAFVELLVSQGLGSAIVQRKVIEPAHLDTVFWAQLVIAGTATAVTIALADTVAKLFHDLQLGTVLRWLSLKFVIMGLSSVQHAVLARELKFRSLAVRTLLATVIGGSVGLIMALMGKGVWALVAQQIVGDAAAVAFLWRASPWRPKFSVSLKHLKELTEFSLSVLGTQLLWACSGRLDQVIIGRALGPVPLGEYALAGRVVTLAGAAIFTPVNAVALPLFSRVQNDRERLLSGFYRAVKLNTVITIPIFIGMAAIAPELVRIGFGPQWTEAGTLLRYIAVGNAIASLCIFSYTLHLSIGRPVIALLMQLLGLLTTIMGAVIGLKWGMRGVATGVVISNIVNVVMWLICMKQTIGLSYVKYIQCSVSPTIASAIMCSVLIPLRNMLLTFSPTVILLICIPVGILLYVGSIFLISPQIGKDIWEFGVAAVFNRSKNQTVAAVNLAAAEVAELSA